jgi:hypothetical protein
MMREVLAVQRRHVHRGEYQVAKRRIMIREVTTDNKGHYLFVSATVVVPGTVESVVEYIRQHVWELGMFLVLKRHLVFKPILHWFLPTGYLEIHVFSKDYRRRRLHGFGLSEQRIGKSIPACDLGAGPEGACRAGRWRAGIG